MGLWSQSSKSLSVDEVVETLERLKAAMPGATSKNPKLGVTKTIDFLKKAETASFEHLIQKLQLQKESSPVRKRAAATANPAIVEDYLQRLKQAGTKNSEFESTVAEMKSDRKVRVIELTQIATVYTGAKPSAKSKAKLFDVLEQVFDQRWKLAHR